MGLTSTRSIQLFLVLILIPVTGAVGAGPSSSAEDRTIRWSRLSEETRKQLHLHVNQVPPFPENDRRLMKVGLWPRTRVFGGKNYVQEFSAWKYDVFRSRLRSLSEIDSGWKYGSEYATYSRDGKRRSRRGPSYMWYPDSTLHERSFVTPSSSQIWSYDLQGSLRVYHETAHGSGCQPSNTIVESFETDGSLVGFESLRPRKYYWMGEELKWEEYSRLRNKLWKWE